MGTTNAEKIVTDFCDALSEDLEASLDYISDKLSLIHI